MRAYSRAAPSGTLALRRPKTRIRWEALKRGVHAESTTRAMTDRSHRRRDVARKHHPVTRDGVGEAAVGHRDDDAVAAPEFVDVAERREVRGAVAGDRRRAAEARERALRIARARVDPRALLEFFGARPVHQHEVRPDARDLDPPHGAAFVRLAFELFREQPDAVVHAVEHREALRHRLRGRRLVERPQRPAQLVLADRRVDRRDRLLPEQRDRRVGRARARRPG